MPGYSLYASPTLYSGQTARAAIAADPANPIPVKAQLFARCFDGDDRPQRIGGGVALVCEEGHQLANEITLEPL